MAPYKKFNAFEREHGYQHEEHNEGDDRKPLRCLNCGGEHHKKDFPSHQGGRPQIYNAQEAHTIGDVG